MDLKSDLKSDCRASSFSFLCFLMFFYLFFMSLRSVGPCPRSSVFTPDLQLSCSSNQLLPKLQHPQDN